MSVGQDASSEPTAAELKDQGNQEYKTGNYLKAAALYAKAIKLLPGSDLALEEQAVLFSNRSAALLQLHKVSKALADADECTKLRPDWDKGYYRRAAALEKLDRLDEALAAYQDAAARGADNRQLSGMEIDPEGRPVRHLFTLQGRRLGQSRLDNVFGALVKPGEQQQWKPSTEQVFRAGGPIADQDASSDEEFEERARREVVPGLAMDLAAEDEPDEEGFRPSTAFCRQLDKEDEYNDVDEMATGTYRGRGGEALPPRHTEVLDDNPWERRVAQQEALHHTADEDPAEAAAEAAAAAPMEADSGFAATAAGVAGDEGTAAALAGAARSNEPQGHGQRLAGPAEQRGRGRLSSSSGSELADERSSEGGEAVPAPAPAGLRPTLARVSRGGQSKRVRFQGVPEPWVPPHRREGYVAREAENSLPPEEVGAGPSGRGNVKPNQRGAAQSRVPDHVKHPEKYTVYTLDEPLVVGGGVGQLGQESHAQMERAAVSAQARQGGEDAEQPEPERWQGAVGGGIEFRRRPKSTAAGPATDLEMNSNEGGGGALSGARVSKAGGAAGAVQLTTLADDDREGAGPPLEEQGGAAEVAAQAPQVLEDADMPDADGRGTIAAMQGMAQFKSRGSRSARGYRSSSSSRAAEDEA
ncbi:hypothetical protein N2152v2_006134 [Parachlorella kessleri]